MKRPSQEILVKQKRILMAMDKLMDVSNERARKELLNVDFSMIKNKRQRITSLLLSSTLKRRSGIIKFKTVISLLYNTMLRKLKIPLKLTRTHRTKI